MWEDKFLYPMDSYRDIKLKKLKLRYLLKDLYINILWNKLLIKNNEQKTINAFYGFYTSAKLDIFYFSD